MTNRAVLIFICTLALGLSPSPHSRAAAAPDRISGTWSDGSGRGLELTFDGKRAVIGTVNPGRPNASPIKTGTFNPKTGVLKIQGMAKPKPDGAEVPFAIEGKLQEGALAGTYDFGGSRGTFTFTKK
jgi:hypothetical protein